jgi:hypothetical protein
MRKTGLSWIGGGATTESTHSRAREWSNRAFCGTFNAPMLGGSRSRAGSGALVEKLDIPKRRIPSAVASNSSLGLRRDLGRARRRGRLATGWQHRPRRTGSFWSHMRIVPRLSPTVA